MTSNKARISALIPSYNRPEFLKITIKSVQNQTFNDLKIIVADDCSNNETVSLLNELSLEDNRLEYFTNETNLGFLKNFKKLFSKVDTEYFSTLADDDCLFPSIYEDAIKYLDKNQHVDVIIFQPLFGDNNFKLKAPVDITKREYRVFSPSEAFSMFFLGNINRTWTSMIFRKKCAELYLEMDPMNFDNGHDMRFLTRVFSKHTVATNSKIGAFYRIHEGNNSNLVINNIISPIANVSRDQRLIEVLNDESVSAEVKLFASSLLKKTIINQMKTRLFAALREILKYLASFKKNKNELFDFFDHNFDMSGKLISNSYKLIVLFPLNYIFSLIAAPLIIAQLIKRKLYLHRISKSSGYVDEKIDYLKKIHDIK